MKSKKYEDINFIHSTHFWMSLGFKIVENPDNGKYDIEISAAFAHKRSPTSKRFVDQFARANGRSVVASRLRALDRTDPQDIPYTAIMYAVEADSVKQLRQAIRKTIWETIDVYTRIWDIPAEKASINEQPANQNLFETILTDLAERFSHADLVA